MRNGEVTCESCPGSQTHKECHTAMTLNRNKKRRKSNKLSTITLGHLSRKEGTWKRDHISRLRVLFDSGCEATLINQEMAKGLEKEKTEATVWKTKAGEFHTDEKCKIKLKLPAFHEHKEMDWSAFIEPTDMESSKCDLIIGRDMMFELGIDLLFSQEKMEWDGASVSMQHPAFLDEPRWVDLLEKQIMFIHDPLTTDAERIQSIIEAKHTEANLEAEVNKLVHLTQEAREQPLQLLKKCEALFDGTLGTWKTDPIELELKDPDGKPHHARPHPVPKSQEQKLR